MKSLSVSCAWCVGSGLAAQDAGRGGRSGILGSGTWGQVRQPGFRAWGQVRQPGSGMRGQRQ